MVRRVRRRVVGVRVALAGAVDPTLGWPSPGAVSTLSCTTGGRARRSVFRVFWPRPSPVDPMRWRRPLALLVLGVIVAAALATDPRPGLHGIGLVVLLALIGVVGGGAVLLFGLPGRRLPAPAELLLFAVVMAGSIVLVWIEPNGTGFFGGFVVASAVAVRIPGRAGAIVVTVFLAVVAVASIAGAQRGIGQTLVSEMGAFAFYRLGLYAQRLRERTEESERLLAELEQSRASQLRAATLAERQRLAREMHDVLAHSLSGLLLHLEGARLLAVHESASPQLTDTIERAHHLAQSGLGEARQAIGTLRGDDLPGPERLPALAAEFADDTGVPCEFTVHGEPEDLATQARLTLYRVAQEALTNVRRHAAPDRVHIRLEYRAEGAALTVEDCRTARVASPPVADDQHGYGITGMRERAELLGGTLSAAATDTGFRVALWIPA
jgi:signal transduction histidine kinase